MFRFPWNTDNLLDYITTKFGERPRHHGDGYGPNLHDLPQPKPPMPEVGTAVRRKGAPQPDPATMVINQLTQELCDQMKEIHNLKEEIMKKDTVIDHLSYYLSQAIERIDGIFDSTCHCPSCTTDKRMHEIVQAWEKKKREEVE